MNEQMEKQLSRILELMVNGLEKAGDVAASELPGLIEDYLSFYMIGLIPIGSVLFFIVCVVVMAIGHKIIQKLIKEDADALVGYVVFLFPIVGACISVGEIIDSSKEMAQIQLAPKAYLIENLRK